MKKMTCLFVFLMLCGIQICFAQMREITGTVIDKADKSPLPGVSVMVKGTATGTATDVNGKFALKVGDNAVLVFSFIGMIPQEISVKGKNDIQVALEQNATMMEEVIVTTGYGETRKGAFTGAATVVNADGIVKRTDPNPIKALDGTVAGLQLNTVSGQPGAPSTVFIRGRNSYNSGTQPLYVIDGVPMSSDQMGMRSGESQTFTPLASINPADIESMTVLKDATATSIYGARAANGVIVITTKKGKSGAMKVNLSVKAGFETVPSFTDNYKLLNQSQYENLQVEGLLNAFPEDYPNANAALVDLYDSFGLKPGEGANTDWFDEVTRRGTIQDYNLDLSTGGVNENSAKFFASFNYFNNKGIVIGKDLKRYSGRFNMSQKVNNIVKYGINSSFSYTDVNMGAGGGYYSDPITLAYGKVNPLVAVKNKLGEWNFDNIQYNPVAQRSKYGDKSNGKQYRAIVSPYITINFTPDLYFTSRGGLDYYDLKEFGTWSFLQPQGKDMRGMGEQGTTSRTLLSISNTLSWLKSYNEHNINLMVGQEAQHTRQNGSYLSGSNYPVDYLNQVALAAVPGSASTDINNVALAGFFFNGQYDYANKYFLSASVRADGSSRFGTDNRWGVFYSVGGRYRISAEKFMQPIENWLSNLTVRASYGTSGNQDVSGSGTEYWYLSRGLYGFGYNYNGAPGSARDQAGNPNLKWEQTNKLNIGVDLGLFNRISIEFDYYYHKTTDMVFRVPISRTTGLTNISQNIGELENKGIEFTVNARAIQKPNVTWDLTFVGGANHNKILKLSTDKPIEGAITIVEPGKDLYTFKMKEWAGVDPQTGAPTWWKTNRDANGKVISKEVTKRYVDATKEYVGQASPKFIGSFSSALKVYGFDFSFQFNYSLGGKIVGDNLRYDEQTGAAGLQNTTQWVYNNRWQQPGDNAKVPKFVYGDKSGANSSSTRYLMKGDYLKLKNITLGYTLPAAWVKAIKLSNVRVFASADNLYTFTNKDYRGFDPAGIDPNGFQWWNYPLPRNVMFGINIGF